MRNTTNEFRYPSFNSTDSNQDKNRTNSYSFSSKDKEKTYSNKFYYKADGININTKNLKSTNYHLKYQNEKEKIKENSLKINKIVSEFCNFNTKIRLNEISLENIKNLLDNKEKIIEDIGIERIMEKLYNYSDSISFTELKNFENKINDLININKNLNIEENLKVKIGNENVKTFLMEFIKKHKDHLMLKFPYNNLIKDEKEEFIKFLKNKIVSKMDSNFDFNNNIKSLSAVNMYNENPQVNELFLHDGVKFTIDINRQSDNILKKNNKPEQNIYDFLGKLNEKNEDIGDFNVLDENFPKNIINNSYFKEDLNRIERTALISDFKEIVNRKDLPLEVAERYFFGTNNLKTAVDGYFWEFYGDNFVSFNLVFPGGKVYKENLKWIEKPDIIFEKVLEIIFNKEKKEVFNFRLIDEMGKIIDVNGKEKYFGSLAIKNNATIHVQYL